MQIEEKLLSYYSSVKQIVKDYKFYKLRIQTYLLELDYVTIIIIISYKYQKI